MVDVFVVLHSSFGTTLRDDNYIVPLTQSLCVCAKTTTNDGLVCDGIAVQVHGSQRANIAHTRPTGRHHYINHIQSAAQLENDEVAARVVSLAHIHIRID